MRWLLLLTLIPLAACGPAGMTAGPGADGPQLMMRSIDPENGRGREMQLRWKGGPHIGFRWHF